MATGEDNEKVFFVNTFMHLIVSQVATRLFFFVLNTLAIRKLTPKEYGTYAIQFHLLITTILFLSREGIRRGCLRERDLSKVARIAWLTVPAGMLITTICCIGAFLWMGSDVSRRAILPYALLGGAAMVEILSEPLYILAKNQNLVKLRVTIEGSATIIRGATLYILLVNEVGKDDGIVFAYAQAAYAFSLLLGYWSYFLTSPRLRHQVFLRKKDDPLLHLCMVYTFQSLNKLMLQEAQKFFVFLFQTSDIQGVYSIVDNLGSLMVRSLLQPFEESAFTMFAKAAEENNTETGAEKQMETIGHSLLVAMKVMNIVGLHFMVYGPSYSYILLRMLYGKEWSDGEACAALSDYCIYIVALATNGVTEAFLQAVATKKQLLSWNISLLGFLFCYVGIILKLTQGNRGLILANICHICMRIAYSTFFINEYFKDCLTFRLIRAFPSWRVLFIFIAAATVTRLSEALFLDRDKFLSSAALHIAIGGVCFILTTLSLYRYEWSIIHEIKGMRFRKDNGHHVD